LYSGSIKIASLFNEKAGKWIAGRRNWQNKISREVKPGEQRIWIHCSSLGEFEQGRPLIEALKEEYPNYKIVLSFFSPSGYEACKDYRGADIICYMPIDGKRNAVRFIATVQPRLVLFVKYEFWYYYLRELNEQNIPTILVSGAFREIQPFFKWYGNIFRKMLSYFKYLFIQDRQSAALLNKIGIKDNVLVAGDTRYDRVAKVAGTIRSIPEIESFKGSSSILIAGSTWPEDEKVLYSCLETLPSDWKMIVAPHEIHSAHIESIQKLFSSDAALFSELKNNPGNNSKRVLIIDNIGMLSSLYAYGDIAYIGGGFQKGGIHNVLEPAVFGLPIIFGPVFDKFVEARELVSLKFAFPVKNAEECVIKLKELISDNAYREAINESLKKFMQHHIGATSLIMEHIRKERWLK
jgi:3-deoxy-D-manno-octulosonic-acid transferase